MISQTGPQERQPLLRPDHCQSKPRFLGIFTLKDSVKITIIALVLVFLSVIMSLSSLYTLLNFKSKQPMTSTRTTPPPSHPQILTAGWNRLPGGSGRNDGNYVPVLVAILIAIHVMSCALAYVLWSWYRKDKTGRVIIWIVTNLTVTFLGMAVSIVLIADSKETFGKGIYTLINLYFSRVVFECFNNKKFQAGLTELSAKEDTGSATHLASNTSESRPLPKKKSKAFLA